MTGARYSTTSVLVDSPSKHRIDPAATLKQLRSRVLGGGRLLLDSLTAEELAAAQQLILRGEAEIVNEACRPYLLAKLDRIILPP